MYADFFAIAYAATMVINRLRVRELGYRIIALVLIVFSGISASGVVKKQITQTPLFVESQQYAPVLLWLNNHTQIDDVVYANALLSNLIPEYTHDNVFYASAATLYIMPQQDVRARFLWQHYFDPFTVADFSNGLTLERQVYGNFYIEQYAHRASLNSMRRLLSMKPIPVARYPEQDIASLAEEETALQQQSFLSIIKGYRVDYIAWDKTKDPEWHLDRILSVSKVYEINNVAIFALPKTQ